jgi:phosphonate transport system substrate-binding protein
MIPFLDLSASWSVITYNRIFVGKRNRIAKAMVVALLLLPFGCGGDPDTVILDFSETIPMARPGENASVSPVIRVAVAAMVSPKETYAYYHQLLDYLGKRAGRHVQFIQKKTYGEVNELIGKGQIDLAFICSGPYAMGGQKYGFDILATPLVRRSPFYNAYLITNENSDILRLEDLRGRTFAFTDPASNTGRLVPIYWLNQIGERPATFFSKSIYTYSHNNSILAVSRNLVDGASVDGHIWEYYARSSPDMVIKTRIIRKSEPYGSPPLVASKSLDENMKNAIRGIVLSMHRDENGQKILKELMIDRFIEPQEEWYDRIRAMARDLATRGMKSHANQKP